MVRRINLQKILVLSLLGVFFSSAKAAEKVLSFERLKHFQISHSYGLATLYREKNKVWSFPSQGPTFFESEYNQDAKEQDLGFGSIKDPLDKSEEIQFPENKKTRRIRGMVPWDNKRYFLDAETRQFIVYDEKKKIWLPSVELILDLLKPAPDPRGEAPHTEIQRLRQAFTKSYSSRSFDPDLMVGLARIPAYWADKDGSQFLLLMRNPSFPLLTVQCKGEGKIQCMAKRACFVDGMSKAEIMNAQGLSFYEEKKELWIGVQTFRYALRMQAPRCYQISRKGEILLPPELKHLSSVVLDAEQNLWVTSSVPDLMHSATLFVWDHKEWSP